MSLLRSVFLSIALAGTASAGDRMSIPGAGAAPAVPRVVSTPAKTGPAVPAAPPAPAAKPGRAVSVPRGPKTAPAFLGKIPAPTGVRKSPPERGWSVMKNRPASPPVSAPAITGAKGAPKALPPGGGVPGKGVGVPRSVIRLTPLDDGLGTTPGATTRRAPRGARSDGAEMRGPERQAVQKKKKKNRMQQSVSDLEKNHDKTRKAIADNIKG